MWVAHFYGKFWYSEGPNGAFEKYVRRRSNFIHHNLPGFNVLDAISHLHQRRDQRLYLCTGLVGCTIGRSFVVPCQLLAGWNDGPAIGFKSHDNNVAANYSGML